MEIESELKMLALEQNISNSIIESDSANKKNEGCLGYVRFVAINGKDATGEKVTLSLVAKGALANVSLRDSFMTQSIVAREIFMYNTVFPTMRFFENKHGITDNSPIAPKCYAILQNKEVIIMEDLKECGYEIFNKSLEMDDQHVEIIFSQYARLHATSLALRVLDRPTFDNIAKHLDKKLFAFFKKSGMYPVFCQIVKKAQCSLNPVTDVDAIRKYNSLVNDLDKTIEGLIEDASNPLLILHGDCWLRNILIKYVGTDSSRRPSSVRLIDFQFAHVGASPVLDLSWFFYTCANKQVMENLKIHQKFYYKEFKNWLQKFGLDSDSVYPYKEFTEEWCRFAKYGLLLASFFRLILLQEPSEEVNFNTVPDSYENIEDHGKYEDIANIEIYYERMRNVIVHFANNNFI